MNDNLFANWGYGNNTTNHSDWKNLLTEKEKSNLKLIELLELYEETVNTPTRDDINGIKEALLVCFPYQIKRAIISVKSHTKYGFKFSRFSYISDRVKSGAFGTRKNNNLPSISNPKSNTKNHNQTSIGFKTVHRSREELIEELDKAALLDENIPFDFNILKR